MKRQTKIKKLTTLLTLSTVFFSLNAQENNTTFSLTLTSDQFFGVAPSVGIEHKLSDKLGVSAYGIFWGAGTGADWGNWTEFGLGLNFYLSEGVSFNPNLGFTFGNLLSKGASDGQLGGIAGDGIVPNFFFNVDIPKFESEVYAGYYAPLRNQAPTEGSTLAYLHYWASAGYKINNLLSFGGHFEHLRRTQDKIGGKLDYYQWLGPYVQFNANNYNSFIRFSAGPELKNGLREKDSFYKLSAGISF